MFSVLLTRTLSDDALKVRGSVPVYWMQQTSATIPKPPIELTAEDVTYAAARCVGVRVLRHLR
jgi:hypothetical protein